MHVAQCCISGTQPRLALAILDPLTKLVWTNWSVHNRVPGPFAAPTAEVAQVPQKCMALEIILTYPYAHSHSVYTFFCGSQTYVYVSAY